MTAKEARSARPDEAGRERSWKKQALWLIVPLAVVEAAALVAVLVQVLD